MGGKRKHLERIYAAIAEAGVPPAEGKTLADPFCGGASVSLWGKALGYRVLANDAAARSEAVARALVENGRVELGDADLVLAFEHDPDGWWAPPVRKLPWPEPARELLVQLASAADGFSEPKRSLLRALVLKVAGRLAMWGQPISLEPGGRIRRGEWDRLTKHQIARVPAFTQPRGVAVREARKLSAGVFSNGLENRASRLDALDFLDGLEADVAYFDPPYPETEHYERHYWAIDGILDNEAPTGGPSRFSRAGGWRHLADVFDAAERIPVWVVSMGDRAQRDELEGLLRDRERVVQTAEARGAHIPAKANKSRDRHELLLVARKEE